MFHAISAFFARLPRRIRAQAYADTELATWHGWTVIHTGLGTYRYRDPRFIYRRFERTQPSSGCFDCDGKIAEWFYDGDHRDPDVTDQTAKDQR